MYLKTKKIAAIVLALALLVAGVNFLVPTESPVHAHTDNSTYTGRTPKYVFMFIGDGMTYPQFTAASSYLGSLKTEGKSVEPAPLGFMEFPYTGTITTHDSTSFCPDSASTATSMATGYKTLSGIINMDEQKTTVYETISGKLKSQKDFKVGVVSSVPINHATPAAYYAAQPSRGNYYEIGLDLINSEFDYFAGGDLLSRTGRNMDQEDLYDLAEKAGYSIFNTKEEILNLSNGNEKVIAISPESQGGAMPYEIDRKSGDLSLADFTRKGIDVLFNETGFFMMVEGGKIDWACHANDAMASIHDTIAFDDAIAEAVKFYNKYPKDTLIIVTGDHETGGMTIGYAGTKYDTHLSDLSGQVVSYEVYNENVSTFREEKISFENVLNDVYENFGLMEKGHKDADAKANMVLSDYEYKQLKKAYTLSMIEKSDRDLGEEEYLTYGGYEPLTIAITHILNNKAGIGWTSYSHTGIPTGVFAMGTGAQLFSGSYDNTDLFMRLVAITKVK